jgi:hypothetical protein
MNIDFKSSAWRLKMNHAISLRNQLESIFSKYQTSQPVDVVDSDWDGFRLNVELSVRKSPDAEWGTIIGDIVHNYHSALDSLYFALISHFANTGGKAVTKWDQEHISFPIFDTAENFAKNTKEIKKYNATQVLNDLLSYQPFEYINEFVQEQQIENVLSGHPLKILRDLSNLDKHRGLHVIHFYLYTHVIGLPDGVTLESGTRPLYFPGQARYSLAFVFKGATLQVKPDFVPEFKLGILSGSANPYSSDVMNLLQAIEGKIWHIMHQLEYHFQPDFGV